MDINILPIKHSLLLIELDGAPNPDMQESARSTRLLTKKSRKRFPFKDHFDRPTIICAIFICLNLIHMS